MILKREIIFYTFYNFFPQQQELLARLIHHMIEATKVLHNAKTESDKKFALQKCELRNEQIDREVYKLYGFE